MTLPSDAAAEGDGYVRRFARAAGRWAVGTALWFLFTLPFSPSVLALANSSYCFTSSFENSAVLCIVWSMAFAPFALFVEPRNPLPPVLLTALLLATTLQVLFTWLIYRERRRPNEPE